MDLQKLEAELNSLRDSNMLNKMLQKLHQTTETNTELEKTNAKLRG